MRLTLPMPPSANHYKKPRRQGGFYLTDEARAFLARVRRLASRCRPIEKGMVAVEYRFFRGERDGRLQRGDLANYEKVLSDALQGRAFPKRLANPPNGARAARGPSPSPRGGPGRELAKAARGAA